MIALSVAGVWFLVIFAQVWLEAPDWAWHPLRAILGVGAMTLIDSSVWWQGLGIGALAYAFALVADLVLLTTDWIRMSILRRGGR
jgi:hypothetical protein